MVSARTACRSGIAAFIRRHPLASYYAFAFTISWLLEAPLIAVEYGWIEWDISESWHYLAALGPISAAVVVASVVGSLRSLIYQYHPSRLKASWLSFAIFSPVALFIVGMAGAWMSGNGWPEYSRVAKTGNLPALGLPLTWLVHVFTFGVGEETGWRGFALPRLLSAHSAIKATLLLTIFWALWHLPTFLYNDNLQTLGPVEVFGWAIGLFAGAIFFTWLYNSSGPSLLTIVLWHGTFNTLIASEAAEGTIAAVMTTTVMLVAAALGSGKTSGIN